MFTRQQIEAAVKAKAYVWFDSNKDYDVNIVGVRNSATGKRLTNQFDDWMTLSYKVSGVWNFHIWPCTTDPGTTYMTRKLLNPRGVARLVPGQYRRSHRIGLHQGKYTALVQNTPVKVYRDANMDTTYDEKTIDEGMYGINIHRSSPNGVSMQVDGWSAGCQVFSNIRHFEQFMQIMRKAEAVSNSFTYTLIESTDIK
jgi:hypothetical protein